MISIIHICGTGSVFNVLNSSPQEVTLTLVTNLISFFCSFKNCCTSPIKPPPTTTKVVSCYLKYTWKIAKYILLKMFCICYTFKGLNYIILSSLEFKCAMSIWTVFTGSNVGYKVIVLCAVWHNNELCTLWDGSTSTKPDLPTRRQSSWHQWNEVAGINQWSQDTVCISWQSPWQLPLHPALWSAATSQQGQHLSCYWTEVSEASFSYIIFYL